MRKGFILPLIVILIILTLIVGTGFLYFSNKKLNPTISHPPVTVSPKPQPSSSPSPVNPSNITDFPIPRANWLSPDKTTFQVFVDCKNDYEQIEGYQQMVIFEGKDLFEAENEIYLPTEGELDKLGWFEEINDAAGGVDGKQQGFAKRGNCLVDKIGKHFLIQMNDSTVIERIEKQKTVQEIPPKTQITILYN